MRGQGGQATIEYAGLLALLALLLGTLATVGAPAAATFARRALAPSRSPAPDLRAEVAALRTGSLAAFLAARADPVRDPRLDWSTDGCSAPVLGDRGRTFDFAAACLRHDFGYRNTKRLGTFRHDRAQIDARFLADMTASCSHRPFWQRPACLRWALLYFGTVRAFGAAA